MANDDDPRHWFRDEFGAKPDKWNPTVLRLEICTGIELSRSDKKWWLQIGGFGQDINVRNRDDAVEVIRLFKEEEIPDGQA